MPSADYDAPYAIVGGEDVETRRRLAREFMAAQGRALNAAARSGPLARIRPRVIPPASTGEAS